MSAFAARRAREEKTTAPLDLPPHEEYSRPKPAKRRTTNRENKPLRSPPSQDNSTTRNKPCVAEKYVQVSDKSISKLNQLISNTLSEADLIDDRDETEDQDIRLVAKR